MNPNRIITLVTLLACTAVSARDQAQTQARRVGPRLDVVFAIDTTGSMGDEIEVVKQRLHGMVAEIASGNPKPDVRFGMVAYKDRGDAYVVKPVHLSRDVNGFYGHIRDLSASGGGDEPEDVVAAISYAVDKMNWDRSREVSKLVFLIGDAGPQQYPGTPSLRTLALRAKEKRIKITTIGCSGLMGSAQSQFQTLAHLSGGKFDVLTYRQVVAQADGTRRTILTRGDRTYAAEGEMDDAEWKRGADAVAKKGRAKPVAPARSGMLGGMGRSAPADAAPAPVTYGENNLDALITEEIKAEAAAAGVAY